MESLSCLWAIAMATILQLLLQVESKMVVPFMKEIKEIDEGQEGFKTEYGFAGHTKAEALKTKIDQVNQILARTLFRHTHTFT